MFDEILPRILGLIQEVLEDPTVSLSPDTEIHSLLNSLTIVALIVKMENEFNLEFEDDDLDLHRFHTPAQIADYVTGKTARNIKGEPIG